MKTKICSKCREEKPMTNTFFAKRKTGKDGFASWCKECKKQYDKNRRAEMKRLNPEALKEIHKEKYQQNKERIKKYSKKYYKDNREKYRAHEREYRQKNKDRLNAYSNEYVKNRYKNDPAFKIKTNCRIRISQAVRNGYKSSDTMDLIGCDIQFLMDHLESQFTDGMSWENYGEWHIDHILPCASFDLSKKENQKECFNYKNLQPLWAEDNIKKSDKVPESTERIEKNG